MQDFCSSFLCWVSVRRKNSGGGGREKNWLMFPLKHVTSARLTAENNLGLRAGGWLTQSLLLLSLGAIDLGLWGGWRQSNGGWSWEQNKWRNDDMLHFLLTSQETKLQLYTLSVCPIFHCSVEKKKKGMPRVIPKHWAQRDNYVVSPGKSSAIWLQFFFFT